MAITTLSSKNQIVVPREARKALGLKPGDKLLVVVHAGRLLILQKPKSYAKALQGIGKGWYSDDYLKKERDSWE
jgi:AbrB family looped-hinge helix DNA binding protein